MNNSIKIMLLGVALILVSLYIQAEPGIKMYGNEFIIGLVGFILVLAGLFKKD
ncbi:hypothetical protein [Paenibacillus sedimenti]|uniref:Uncharacterized protein n=1 Tax=Paenibacillus sedimenti TaxID=2770274 RepID=A0A926QM03_9BACL|nr:hypothetical protein [Paenibacillus sedimenti]MBD0384461.1 hypothetical protein [Paenibacillus sedimenti]